MSTLMTSISSFIHRIGRYLLRLRLQYRIFQINRKVSAHARPEAGQKPVVFFNASARLRGLNLNAAFAMISSWSVQLAGVPVVHFACQAGMSRCVLGAGLGDPTDPPPCRGCVADTRRFTGAAPTLWFSYRPDPGLRELVAEASVPDLERVEYKGIPLGELVLPSMRWILRRHHLRDDPTTRFLYREFLLSAYNIAREFQELLQNLDPRAVVVFNGLQYPEATARWIAQQRGIRVITHEVNLQPFSAFFSDGHATIYPMDLPEHFQLTNSQNKRLDRYLNKRFQGDFTMAGIQFWSGMEQLSEDFLAYAGSFKAIVPVFTNVVFDTSQAHANTIFPHMFAWLDQLREAAPHHPETLFVVRAHPDELREGKKSQESVADWMETHRLDQLSNVVFISSEETLSSYDLISRSKFVMVYNSSIGLEATLLGKPVLCGGKSRYTRYPIVYFPASKEDFSRTLEEFLQAEAVSLPDEFRENARRFLYAQLFQFALPFEDYLFPHPSAGYVQLKRFSWKKLDPGQSPVLKTIVDGILDGQEFKLPPDYEERYW